MNRYFAVIVAAGAMTIAGCSASGSAETEAEAPTSEEIQPIADYTGPASAPQSTWPCFNVRNVGLNLARPWGRVVAAQGADDQEYYLEGLIDNADYMYEEIEDDTTCGGGLELTQFNYELSLLRADVTTDSDDGGRYETIADLGNTILDLSAEENLGSDFEFVSEP